MLIVANWKAYVESVSKAKALVVSAKKLGIKKGVEIIIAPPAPYLGLLVQKRSTIAFASQDISDSTGGASTGEITAALLHDLGVSYTIIGHSERRAMGEQDARISSKVQRALAQGLIPIVCIGEHERDSEATYLQFLRAQVSSIFSPLELQERRRVILAYEPLWAIGKSAAESITPHDLHEMVLYIRKVVSDFLPGAAADKIPVLYGGSVEPANIRLLASGSQVDGFLVGHASVEVATFSALVKAIS